MRRTIALVLFAGLVVALREPSASAHALVLRSDPANGAVLQQSPTQVVITFTEPPDLGLSIVHVLNSSGAGVETSKAQAVPGEPSGLRVSVGELPQGVYTVTWRVVSRTDGHVTAGSFSFGVKVSPAGAPKPTGQPSPNTPAPAPLAVAGRWAFYWGLAVLLGGAAFGLLVDRGLPSGSRILFVVAWVAAALGLVMMTLSERSTVGVSLGPLLRSGAGGEFARRGVALLVVGAAAAAAVLRPGRASLIAVGATTAGAMLVHALAGHAGAVTGMAARWFDLFVQTVHLVAVGVWVGGLAWLLLSIRGQGPQGRAGVVRRFSWLAGSALAAVAVTGTLRAVSELGGVHAIRGLLHTSFGVTLLIKVALFTGLVSLGALNRYRNVPAVESGRRPMRTLRRTVAAEVVLAAAILAVTGVLSEFPPASSVAAATRPIVAPTTVTVAGNDFATTVRVKLTVTPGTVGPNEFRAVVTDYDTGKPVAASAISLTFALPGKPELGSPTLALTRGAGGSWTGSGTVLAQFGRWDVSVLVQQSAGSTTVPLQLTPRLPYEDIQVAKAPGEPDIFTITLSSGTLQSYVDPGTGGPNTVHFTFFKTSGDEQPITSATATALAPSGQIEDLPLVRFDSGHFVANAQLASGPWTFLISAQTPDGRSLSAYFTQRIG